jgi:hypothetical protein
VSHDRKPLRAALSTLGGLQRTLSSSPALVASCMSVVGCTHQTRYTSVSRDAVRDGTGEVEQHGTGHVVDAVGSSHDVSRDTKLLTGTGEEVSVGGLLDACRLPRGTKDCPLDHADLQWNLTDRHLVVDKGLISGTLVVAGLAALAYGNYECIGPGCSTGAEVAVGLGDAVLVLTTVALVEVAKNIGNVASCGPLAPPCMPREETT